MAIIIRVKSFHIRPNA